MAENLQNIAVLEVTTYKNAGYSRIRITGIKKFKDVHSPTAMDGGGSILASFLRSKNTRSLKMYTDVHF